MTRLRVENLFLDFGGTRVLDSVSLDVQDGEFLALLGKSGCGKTTLLKAIAGLIQPGSGDILFDDQSVLGKVPEARSAVMVFQKPLLFPHLNIAENVAFGLAMKGISKSERLALAEDALKLVQLPGYGNRRPASLSGGQEQRAALARALVTRPRLLLLDEPFSALDDGLRREMRELVRDIQRQTAITTIFVTHDQDEAVTVADRIALMHNGQLVQEGPPRDFFTRPASIQVAHFFGWCVVEAGEIDGFSDVIPTADFAAFLPENACLAERPDSEAVSLPVSIVESLDFGKWSRYRIKLQSGQALTVKSGLTGLSGDQTLWIPRDGLVWFTA